MKLGIQSCNDSSCPGGFEGWASLEGRHIEDVVTAMSLKVPHRIAKPIHVVAAPAPELFELFRGDEGSASFNHARRLVCEALRLAGFNCGAIVFHAFREACRQCGRRRPSEDGKDPSCACARSSFDWVWSPHFHAVGFGWIVDAASVQRETGILIHNLGTRQSVKATVQYLLSHAGVHTHAGISPNSETHSGSDRVQRKPKGRIQTITWLRPISRVVLDHEGSRLLVSGVKIPFKFPAKVTKALCEDCGFAMTAYSNLALIDRFKDLPSSLSREVFDAVFMGLAPPQGFIEV